MDSTSSWRAERRAALAAHDAALQRRRAAEADQARELIAAFVREMRALGVQPGPLRAGVPDGGPAYRTNVTGWYLRADRSLGIGIGGEYYVLDTPRRLLSRFTGVDIDPVEPPLVVGVGARDGQSRPLEQLLQVRIEAARKA